MINHPEYAINSLLKYLPNTIITKGFLFCYTCFISSIATAVCALPSFTILELYLDLTWFRWTYRQTKN